MEDLARLAGVSRSTVSRALRNDPRISPQTRQRIRHLAQSAGYKANPMVAALMASLRQSRPVEGHPIIAYLTAYPDRNGWRKSQANNLLYEGANERCEQLGFRLELFWLGDADWNATHMGRILHTRGIRGLLLAPLADPKDAKRLALPWQYFATAALGRSTAALPLHRAVSDQFHLMHALLHDLWQNGYRRIGVALHEVEHEKSGCLLMGALAVFQATIPKGNRLPPFLPSQFTEENIKKWCLRYKPEIIITRHTNISTWVTVYAPAVEVLSLSFAAETVRAIGANGIDLIISQLNRNEFGIPARPKTISIEANNAFCPSPGEAPPPAQCLKNIPWF